MAKLILNIDSEIEICPGDWLILRCVHEANTHRWCVDPGTSSEQCHTFVKGEELDSLELIQNLGPGEEAEYRFNLTLVSNDYHNFESTFSTLVRDTLHNTVVECAASTSRNEVTLKLTGTLY